MDRNDRIVLMAIMLRNLIREETEATRLRAYVELASGLKPMLDELADAGIIGQDVGLELNEYAQLKEDGASVAEEYGDSVDLGLEKYRSKNAKS